MTDQLSEWSVADLAHAIRHQTADVQASWSYCSQRCGRTARGGRVCVECLRAEGERRKGVSHYYNEFEPFPAKWLRNLINDGQIPEGRIDGRDIRNVRGDDLADFTQCHFFAGIGGWPLALRLAGWPEDRPVWTGSCPCQPFSAAGKRKGTEDARHLWPEFRRLIAERMPAAIFGEQVASADGREWLAGVRADLEAMGYAVGAADLCAAGEGAPHIRQRLFWMAYADDNGRGTRSRFNDRVEAAVRGERCINACENGGTGGISNASGKRWNSGNRASGTNGPDASDDSGLRHSIVPQLEGHAGYGDDRNESGRLASVENGPTAAAVLACDWSDFDVLPFRDGKSRRVESGSFPLAHGVPGRVGRISAYGNAIVPLTAAKFIGAFLDVESESSP